MARAIDQSIEPRIKLLDEMFRLHRDPVRAKQSQAYLKTNQPLFGLPAKLRKQCLQKSLSTYPIGTFTDFEQTVLLLWQQPERDFQYCAIDAATKYKKFHTDAAWPAFEKLALEAKWWDLSDSISCNLIGSLLKNNRDRQLILNKWMLDEDLWVRRTSLLAHLKHKSDTDTGVLKKTILTIADDKQFFIQKAIGWALREYSKTNSLWVSEFFKKHSEKLSNLAVKEGSKYL